MSKTSILKVKDVEISVIKHGSEDYISLTDMIKAKEGHFFIESWLRNRNTVEFLGIWESLNNPSFNSHDFEGIKKVAGLNSFNISVKEWVSKTNAKGLYAKAGRYGGTYAHKDIAFEFGTWISPEFKLYLIREFQRLKEQESKYLGTEWDYRRFLAKANYRVQTDAIKDVLIPKLNIPKDKESYIYADQAELLNVIIFGKSSREWRAENPDAVLNGLNIRDMADIHQLTVLSNLEGLNAALTRQGIPARDRAQQLRTEAIAQLKSLRSMPYNIASIQSPFSNNENTTSYDQSLKGLLNTPPPKKEKKKKE